MVEAAVQRLVDQARAARGGFSTRGCVSGGSAAAAAGWDGIPSGTEELEAAVRLASGTGDQVEDLSQLRTSPWIVLGEQPRFHLAEQHRDLKLVEGRVAARIDEAKAHGSGGIRCLDEPGDAPAGVVDRLDRSPIRMLPVK